VTHFYYKCTEIKVAND